MLELNKDNQPSETSTPDTNTAPPPAHVNESDHTMDTTAPDDAALAANYALRLEAAGLLDAAAEAREWHQTFTSSLPNTGCVPKEQPRSPETANKPLLTTPSVDSSKQSSTLIGGAIKRRRCGECTKPLNETETQLCALCAADNRSRAGAGKYTPPSRRGVCSSRTSTLRVSNLDTDQDSRAIEADLRHMFGACGRIQRVNVPLDQWTGTPRGFAFVEFTDGGAAQRAVDTHEAEPFVLGYMKLLLDIAVDTEDLYADTYAEYKTSGARKVYDFSGLKTLM